MKKLTKILLIALMVMVMVPTQVRANYECVNCSVDDDYYYTTPEWEQMVKEYNNNVSRRRDWGVSYNMTRYAQDNYPDTMLFENGYCKDTIKESGCAFLSLYQAARSLGTYSGTVLQANALMGKTTNTCKVNWSSSPQSIGLTLVNRQDANWNDVSTKRRIMTALDNDYRVVLQFNSGGGLHYATVYAYYWSTDPDDPTVYIRDPGYYNWKTVDEVIDEGYYLEKIVVVS